MEINDEHGCAEQLTHLHVLFHLSLPTGSGQIPTHTVQGIYRLTVYPCETRVLRDLSLRILLSRGRQGLTQVYKEAEETW